MMYNDQITCAGNGDSLKHGAYRRQVYLVL